MGIKGLKKFLIDKYQLVKQTHLSAYTGQRVAIDASGIIYKLKIINPNKWLDSFIHYCVAFKKFDISSIFVFDGKPPIEKMEEMKKRKEAKNKQEERVFLLETAIERYHNEGIIDSVLEKEMSDYQSSLAKPVADLLGKSSQAKININYLESKLIKLSQGIPKINSEDIELIKQFLDLAGLPFVQAPGEAEVYCAYLYKIGHVKVVFSNDTDNLVHGVENLIFDLNPYSFVCESIKLSEVLSALELHFPEFVDFCIMCETDYNQNIRGVGIITSYGHIKKYRTIERVGDEKKLDLTSLKHIRNREMFKFSEDPVLKEIKIPYTKAIEFGKLAEFLFKKGSRVKMSTIQDAWAPIELVFS